MDNEDFLTAMENFDEFIKTELKEDSTNQRPYPVGIGYLGVKIYFMHYKTFEEANAKWEDRKKRINKENLTIWLTNYNSKDYKKGMVVFKRFKNLPFKHKLTFSGIKIDDPEVIYLKGYNDKSKRRNNIFNKKWVFGKRWIDDFNYVEYLNKLK